jgi:hypothetical protein
MTPDTWAKSLPPPNADNRALERRFLDEHWQYGGCVHAETATALVAALGTPSTMAAGHSLYLRLFTEYATALETLGAWGWTFCNYRPRHLFLDAFLAYPSSAPRESFTRVRRNRSGSLNRLLDLSRSSRVTPVLAAGFEMTVPQFEDRARKLVVELRRAADQYFTDDEIIRTTYNKAKHGATMVRTPDLGPREFYVLAPHLTVPSGHDRARYTLSKFTVDKAMITTIEKGTKAAGTLTRLLAGIARALLDGGLLYGAADPVRAREIARSQTA